MCLQCDKLILIRTMNTQRKNIFVYDKLCLCLPYAYQPFSSDLENNLESKSFQKLKEDQKQDLISSFYVLLCKIYFTKQGNHSFLIKVFETIYLS